MKQPRLERVASRIGCTEGQLYSMVIALTSATGLVLVSGVPLGDAPRAAAAPVLASPAQAPAPVVGPSPGNPPSSPPELVTLQPPAQVPDVLAPLDQPAVPDEPDGSSAPSAPFSARVPAPGAPAALASDAMSVYVGTDNAAGPASRLLIFSRTGDNARSIGITGQPSSRAGGLSAAVKQGVYVLATDRSRAALLQVDPRTGQQEVLTHLPDLPPCLVGIPGTCQPGVRDLPPSPEGLAVVGTFAYVADAGQGTIWRYGLATKQLTAWYSSSDFTTGRGPSGLSPDGDGNLVFTVGETVDTAALLRGALYRLAIDAEGAADARTLLASFDSAAVPGPVAVGRSGDTYVGLRGAGGVVVVRPDGAVTTPVPAALAPGPGGLSLANGVLYVADAGRPATATSGRVLSFTVSDEP